MARPKDNTAYLRNELKTLRGECRSLKKISNHLQVRLSDTQNIIKWDKKAKKKTTRMEKKVAQMRTDIEMLIDLHQRITAECEEIAISVKAIIAQENEGDIELEKNFLSVPTSLKGIVITPDIKETMEELWQRMTDERLSD